MLTRIRNLALALTIAACAPTTPTGQAGGAVQSCFATSDGTVCVDTPDGAETSGVDANGDGTVDPFVCADDDSDGDGSVDAFDSDDDNDGIDDFDDSDDDGDGTADSPDDDGTPDQGSGDAPGTPGSDDDGGSGDDDGTPDQGSGDAPGTDGSDDDGGVGPDDDGGVSSDSDGNGVDDSIQCNACNRGPGESGDFRLDVESDGEAELERGVVSAISGTVITVTAPAPVVIGGATVTDILIHTDGADVEGTITVGAEIRARGEAQPDGSIAAERVELLCAAP